MAINTSEKLTISISKEDIMTLLALVGAAESGISIGIGIGFIIFSHIYHNADFGLGGVGLTTIGIRSSIDMVKFMKVNSKQ